MRTITLLAASRLDFTSLQQDGIKLLALLLMMGDHANAALHLNIDALMWLGRGAFPLFALVWGFNLAQRPVTQRQATRLWLWALVTQPVYWQAVAPDAGVLDDMNILFTFAVATQCCYWLQTKVENNGNYADVLAILLIICWPLFFPLGGFGAAGLLLLMACFRFYAGWPLALSHMWADNLRTLMAVAICLLTILLNINGGAIPMLSGLLVSAVVLLVSTALRPLDTVREMRLLPRQFFPVAYIAHLALLWTLSVGLSWSA
ncbi:conjugal transfer pilus acetylase TraX (plasmid) [Serratia marcescens]|nr:conjugal transfer pilus acetylase TraX [Serratia marcescens]